MPKAILLDVDGTLIDSNDQHAESWVEALAEHGIKVPFGKVRPLIGMGGDRLLPAVSGLTEDSAPGKAIGETRKRIFKDRFLPWLKPFPGTRDLLLRMRDQGLKLTVASSSDEETLGELLKMAKVDDLIEQATSKDDAESSKPAPDIIEAALKVAGITAKEALMLGDTPYDIRAAKNAGVLTVAFLCGGWDRQSLDGAIAIYKDPADCLARFESSPFYKLRAGELSL